MFYRKKVDELVDWIAFDSGSDSKREDNLLEHKHVYKAILCVSADPANVSSRCSSKALILKPTVLGVATHGAVDDVTSVQGKDKHGVDAC